MPSIAIPLRCSSVLGLGLLLGLACNAQPAQAECRQVWSYSAHDTANGNLGLAPIILTAEQFQPSGSVLGMANISVARNANVDPETIAYDCLPGDGPFYEYFATNGTDALSGKQEVSGMPGYFHTLWRNVAIKITHNQSGQTFSRTWQRRPLSGDYNPATGRVEFKARHFSDVTVELARVSDSAGQPGSLAEGTYTLARPNAYIAFQGGGFSATLSPGCDHGNGCASNQRQHWPAAIGLWNGVSISRRTTCAVHAATPLVDFGRVSLNQLQSGNSPRARMSIEIECNSPALDERSSGGQVTVGLQVAPDSYLALQRHHPQRLDPGGGAQVLLSSGYGSDPTVATGVGVQIHDQNQRPLLLAGWNPSDASPSGNGDGWYSAQAPLLTRSAGLPGHTRYSGQFSATLVPLAQRITPGRIDATVNVVVRVR
ncbi:fimbrial protein [Pseudomonas sp. Au-Pse12]|uniref:fimbrial protein n=1 Tax=Pseudomonas sp. Au-Pse12 TaxID=2906459 RepID=UPI001E3D5138|nr:fimbrial protein [Pseudomonas sp. Au-Pse12]MCE4056854.1 fimbrial protein [Pseudomonas sp. Au-Pse12]